MQNTPCILACSVSLHTISGADMCIQTRRSPINQRRERSINMKKLTSIFLCAVMILTMMSMVIPASAVHYFTEPGGSLRNTGVSHAEGYSTRGTTGQIYFTCRIFKSSSMVSATMESGDIGMGSNAYINVYAWYANGSTSNNQQRSPSSYIDTNHTVNVPATSTPVAGTAGYEYSSTRYGYFICGTTVGTLP